MSDNSNSLLMIANPFAGRKRRPFHVPVEHLGKTIRWETTQGIGHAESLAYQGSLEGVLAVIAVGGDGTIHEILNGLMRNSKNRTALGWIPSGTANDYAASFETQHLPAFSRQRVDVGVLRWESGYRYFANVAGVGLSGAVADQARSMHRIPARLRYTASLVMQFGSSFGARPLSIELDDAPAKDTQTLLLSAAIGKREGSYPLHPQADLSDGLFEVLRLGRLHRRELAWHFPTMLRGVLPKSHPEIEQMRCRRIAISSDAPIPVHLDGEPLVGNSQNALHHFCLEVIPNAIECIHLKLG